MTARPRVLDLFSGAGGAAVGYHRAGFDVVGVDVEPQPRYPFEFHQLDALALLAAGGWWSGYPERGAGVYHSLSDFDAIHASPVCKAHTHARNMWAGRLPDERHPDLLTPTRALLEQTGLPWIIENVPGAPMRRDVVLCGSQFGLGVRRHRWFECSFPVFSLMHPCAHDRDIVSVFGGGALGSTPRGGRYHADGRHSVMQSRTHVPHADASAAMGIDWMTRDEFSQAIPPDYCQWIGQQLLQVLEATP